MIAVGAIEKALFSPMSVVDKITYIEHKDLAMIINAPPRFVGAFFRTIRSELIKPQFHRLWVLVLGMLLNVIRAKLAHLMLTHHPGARRDWPVLDCPFTGKPVLADAACRGMSDKT